MAATTVTMAFDRSARTYDDDGRLHVRVSNISKAAVNPYYGREIPKHRELGLDPNKVYYLLRDPEELERAAPTFNNLPLLSEHVPVTADDEESHQPHLVVGSLGTDASWSAPYLRNSLVIWAGPAIAGVESRDVQELSAGYRYDAVMEPGTYKGLHFDGRMTNIRGNHVCLVESGRAGSDVVVGDSQFEGHIMLKSRTALMLSGALTALIGPRLKAGMAFDASPFVTGVTRANYAKATADLPARLVRKATPLLAADEGLNVDDVVGIIGALNGVVPATETDVIEPEQPAVDDDGDVVSKICAMLEGKVDDDTMAAVRNFGVEKPAVVAGDEEDDNTPPPGEDPKEDDKPAMDRKTVLTLVREETAALREAERIAFPHVGQVAMDSAGAIYQFVLESAGVKLAGVPASAFKAMAEALPAPGARRTREPIAQDAKPSATFVERFPTAGRLKRAV